MLFQNYMYLRDAVAKDFHSSSLTEKFTKTIQEQIWSLCITWKRLKLWAVKEWYPASATLKQTISLHLLKYLTPILLQLTFQLISLTQVFRKTNLLPKYEFLPALTASRRKPSVGVLPISNMTECGSTRDFARSDTPVRVLLIQRRCSNKA